MDYTGIPKTSAIIFTGAGPLDEKSYIENYSDLANINTKLLIQGQSIFCKETSKEYIYIGDKWMFKLNNYVATLNELNSLDTSMIILGQMITCAENGGHYLFQNNKWNLWEQITFDSVYPIGFCYNCINTITLPQPLAPASCTWEELTEYDGKVLYPSSSSSLGTAVSQNILVEDHNLTTEEIPSHTHSYDKSNSTSNSTTLTIDQIPSHTHTKTLYSCYGSGYKSGQVAWACGDTSRGSGTVTTDSRGGGQGHTHGISTTSTNSGSLGGSQGHNHIITAGAKLDGVTIKIYKRTK